MSSRQIRVALTSAEVEFIDGLAEADGITFSAELRHLIKLGLDAAKRDASDQLDELCRVSDLETWLDIAMPKAGRLIKLLEEVTG